MNTTIIYPDMFDSDKIIKEHFFDAILHGGYRIYEYCRKHPETIIAARENEIVDIIKS